MFWFTFEYENSGFAYAEVTSYSAFVHIFIIRGNYLGLPYIYMKNEEPLYERI